MQEALKTREVSSRLGVAPRTVRKWIKEFGIACDKNDNGHYLITEEVLQRLQEVKQLEPEQNEGTRTHKHIVQEEVVSISEWKSLVGELASRIDYLERQLEQKADEVVSYQVLQHRSEIDGVVKKLEKIENRMDMFEERENFTITETEIAITKPEKRNWLANIFSL